MNIDVVKEETITVLRLSGAMRTGKADVQLREKVLGELELGSSRFVLDMLDVPWLDSGSLGEIVACKKRISERGGEVKLVFRDKVHDVFVIAGLMSAFETFTDRGEALASFD